MGLQNFVVVKWLVDAGLVDAGLVDAGLLDAGLADAGLVGAVANLLFFMAYQHWYQLYLLSVHSLHK